MYLRQSVFTACSLFLGQFIISAAEWCPEGFFLEAESPYGGARRCAPCDASCPVGKYLKGCENTTEGVCEPCTNMRPPVSHYSSGGGLVNDCQWKCNEGYYFNGKECIECNGMCPVGQYVKHCNGTSPGNCVPCSGLWEGILFTGNGGLSDSCPRTCNLGWWEQEPGECIECNISSCAIGKYRADCRGTSPGYCAPCLNDNGNATYLSHGNIHGQCPISCGKGSHSINGTCVTCDKFCGIGRYFEGCTNFVTGGCTNCTKKPDDSHYVGGGHLSDSCPWRCDKDWYDYKGKGECLPCKMTKSCGVGMYRSGCGNRSMGICKRCTNAEKMGFTHYTTTGGIRNACSWECDETLYYNGHNCTTCAGKCPIGEYRIGCGVAKKGKCVKCTNAPFLPFYRWEKLHDVEDEIPDCHWRCPLSFPWDGGVDASCGAVILVDGVVFPLLLAVVIRLIILLVRMALIKMRPRPQPAPSYRTLLAEDIPKPPGNGNQPLVYNPHFPVNGNPSFSGAVNSAGGQWAPGPAYSPRTPALQQQQLPVQQQQQMPVQWIGGQGQSVSGMELQPLQAGIEPQEDVFLDTMGDQYTMSDEFPVDTGMDTGYMPEVDSPPPRALANEPWSRAGDNVQAIEFEVLLDRSRGERLGIDVDHQNGVALLVEAVTGGLMQGWNYSNPDCEVQAGDQVVEVNGIRGNAWRLLNECEQQKILRLVIERIPFSPEF